MTDYPYDDAVELPVSGRTSRHWTLQIQLLTRAIEDQPEAAVNYLLRGEEWLVAGDRERARLDFERARICAEDGLGRSAWGYIYQAYIDRAEIGLRQCCNSDQ